MIHKTINLKELYPTLKGNPILTSYCPDNFSEFSTNKKRKCVLILPGGGYIWVSAREAEPVALRFLGEDIACFVLTYTCRPFEYPTPIDEVFSALSYIRRNSEIYHIDVDKISVLGFSAGGHLAATCACYCENEEYSKMFNIPLKEMKINGCILGYPVISTEYGHLESIQNITQNKENLMDFLSIDKVAGKNFPKTFIWHTTFDSVVSIKNTLLLADRLSEMKVFYELHIYPMHDHGQSLSDYSVYNENYTQQFIDEIKHNTQWVDNAIHFVEEYI
jgi:acetyl esterase/lipase